MDHEYGPISGLADFTRLSAELAFGKSGGDVVKAGRVSVWGRTGHGHPGVAWNFSC